MNKHIRFTEFWDVVETSTKHTHTCMFKKKPTLAHMFVYSAFSHQ